MEGAYLQRSSLKHIHQLRADATAFAAEFGYTTPA